MCLHAGIDVGKGGAVGLVSDGGIYVGVFDLPMEPVRLGKTGKMQWRLDVPEFERIVHPFRGHIRACTVEALWANPTNGSMTGFAMGRLYGAIEVALLKVLRMPQKHCRFVAPIKWKRHYGLIGKEKRASLDLARELFVGAPLRLQKHHNRAEALLLALYGTKEGS